MLVTTGDVRTFDTVGVGALFAYPTGTSNYYSKVANTPDTPIVGTPFNALSVEDSIGHLYTTGERLLMSADDLVEVAVRT